MEELIEKIRNMNAEELNEFIVRASELLNQQSDSEQQQ